MSVKRHLFWFVILVLSVFFLWQLYLIVFVIGDLLRGVPTTFDLSSKKSLLQSSSRSKIPPIIHQMWKTKNLSDYPIRTSYIDWKKLYPDYEIQLWTNDDLEKLISSKTYRFLEQTYRSYPFNIQRADLARLVVLHHQGGIYVDLDVAPKNRSIDKLRQLNTSFVIPRAASGSSLINHFLASEPQSLVLDYILHQVPENSLSHRIFLLPYLHVFSTGSIFLTRVIRQFIENHSRSDKNILVLSNEQVNSLIVHRTGRSWHLVDGYLLNQVDNIPRLSRCSWLFIVFIISLLIYVFVCHPMSFFSFFHNPKLYINRLHLIKTI